MTWLPDHRATHGPDSDCEACRPLEPARAAVPCLDTKGSGSLRPDLVIEPGTNRK